MTTQITDEQADRVAKLYNSGVWDLLSDEQKGKQRDAIRAALSSAKDEPCLWTVQDEDLALWDTGCGEAWVFTECSPAESNIKYCPNCGKRAALLPDTEGE